jgi:hypothetical protein
MVASMAHTCTDRIHTLIAWFLSVTMVCVCARLAVFRMLKSGNISLFEPMEEVAVSYLWMPTVRWEMTEG